MNHLRQFGIMILIVLPARYSGTHPCNDRESF